jgi:hypothetical protein
MRTHASTHKKTQRMQHVDKHSNAGHNLAKQQLLRNIRGKSASSRQMQICGVQHHPKPVPQFIRKLLGYHRKFPVLSRGLFLHV